jgi:hypothetical protein
VLRIGQPLAMRIFKIELPATLTSIDPDISLASDPLREQLRRELDAVTYELGETVRQRAASYFPPEFTLFARFSFFTADNRALVTLWIDDPTVGWPSGLFARRAWRLLVPIVTHVVRESFEARVRSIRIEVDEKRVRVASLAPARAWNDPVILAVVVTLLGAGFWLLVHPWLWGLLGRGR